MTILSYTVSNCRLFIYLNKQTWDSAGKKPMAIFSLAYCSKCNHVFSRSTFELTMYFYRLWAQTRLRNNKIKTRIWAFFFPRKLSYDHTLLYQSRNNDEVSSKKAGLNQDFLELNLDLVGCVTEDNNFHVGYLITCNKRLTSLCLGRLKLEPRAKYLPFSWKYLYFHFFRYCWIITWLLAGCRWWFFPLRNWPSHKEPIFHRNCGSRRA